MLTHEGIWTAIDRLAAKHGLSPSALARRSGLDPTAFNKSKRCARSGKARWPSTESIAKILTATETRMCDFVAMMHSEAIMPSRLHSVPTGMVNARHFDELGRPDGDDWEQVDFPCGGDPAAFALEVTDDSLAPAFRNGEFIIVCPSAECRRGDRVAICTDDGEVLVMELVRRTARRVSLRSLNGAGTERTVDRKNLRWLYRVAWSQY
ncbi:S24 family peptidase [Minwuia thermotolerans]|uniref:DNA-binding protein n=1 Tax=Minwuia thermotolerans TaxID=2056226 RepID=A0A2M9G5N0_9PROT|nr:helix-turn-helix transcriptional regulator [Minwuia thermotolerans]PJK31010.1 DNA-binding protein [Minwuia thermotolerans]